MSDDPFRDKTEEQNHEADVRAHYAKPTNGFITKDSGQRAQFSNGGVRDTQAGKPRFDLTLPKNVPYLDQLWTRLALHMGRGAEKYDERNWEQFADVDALERARSSALRHLLQLINGEIDEDHAAAAVFNIMVILYVEGVLAGKWEPLKAKADEISAWMVLHRALPNPPGWNPAHNMDARSSDECPACAQPQRAVFKGELS